MKTASFVLTILALIIEATMAIPFFGLVIAFIFSHFFLILTFIIHTANLVLRVKMKSSFTTPIFGIIASLLALIPFIGWILHVTVTILLIIDLIRLDFKDDYL